ncbi:MAG: MFS transporter [Alicyclobacillus sp.]|nr:MFS transporter [Alicyclobacillus sp.]
MYARVKHRWWLIAPALFLMWFIANIDKLGISIFITNDRFLTDLGMRNQPTLIGFTVTAFTLAYSVCNLIWGFVVDHLGPRRTGVLGVIIWSLSMVLGGMSTSYGWFLLARMLLGVGEGVMWAVSGKFVVNWFARHERAKAQAVYNYGQYMGPAVGAPVIVALLATSGWRTAFYALGLASFILLIPVLLWLTRDEPVDGAASGAVRVQPVPETAEEIPAGQLFRSGRYWLVVVGYFAQSVGYFGLGSWLPSYLKTARHFSGAAVSGWTSIAWLFAAVAICIASFLADRTRRHTLLGAIAYLLAMVCMTLCIYTDNPQVGAAAISIGFGINAVNSNLCPTILQNTIGRASVGRATGVMLGVTNIISGFAPTIIGYLIHLFGGSYNAGLGFIIVCVIIGAISMFSLMAAEQRAQRMSVAA